MRGGIMKTGYTPGPWKYAEFIADGGPFDSQSIEFAECPQHVPDYKNDQYQTAVLEIGGTRGRYSVRMQIGTGTFAVWVPA
jgi:hypothetical protein